MFNAKTLDGKYVKGEVKAGSEKEARVKIQAQKLIPIKLVAKADPKEKGSGHLSEMFNFGGGVDPKELQVFTRQFAVLIASGVPIVQSLEAMIGPGRSPTLNKTLKEMMQEVSQGRRLADAMKKHPKVFDQMYTNLVHAGEEGGVMDTVLNRLAEYIEKSVKLRGKIKGALFYPIAVIVVAALVITGIMVFVIPKFVQIFEESGMEIPYLTTLVIDASAWFGANWWVVAGIMFGTPIAFKSYYATKDGRIMFDQIFIKIPLFGDLIKKGAVARFSRTMSTMLSAGVRIVEALDIAAGTVNNYVIEQVILEAKNSISKGRTLSEPIKASPVIPDMVSQMIMVGEQTGNLDTMLDKVATFYEEEVEGTADALTGVIEPIMMVVLGGIIAVLVVAMYLPVFNMAGAF